MRVSELVQFTHPPPSATTYKAKRLHYVQQLLNAIEIGHRAELQGVKLLRPVASTSDRQLALPALSSSRAA